MLDQIKQDLKTAMLSKDQVSTNTLRMLVSEINNASISKGSDLTDQDIIGVVQKELKKRKEAAIGFRQGGREESAVAEETEAAVLEKYLPAQMSDEELQKLIEETITSTGAASMADMGKVIGIVMGKAGQSAAGDRVSAMIKAKLAG
jgi:uncharacterized protein YqeY